ncbi:MAG: flap endonuclease-1 [Candidatus Micrarchaeia archaeon]
MAVDLGKFVNEVKKPISFQELSGKRLAIDAYNTIYQFLSIIRQPDGTPLVDSKNRVTSHLSGIFYRTISMIENGIIPIYVFDGMPPLLKQRTIEARANKRKEAYEEWQEAKAKGLIEEARMHAMASSRVNKQIIESSKALLSAMGVPHIQAPSEGEAQAAKMVSENLVYAAASQDYDLFLFGSEVVIRNLAITGKRKLPRKNIYIEVSTEKALLSDMLKKLEITREQLIWIGILMGTDFNLGIEGVGPATALKLVKQMPNAADLVKYARDKYGDFDVDPFEVEKIFIEPEVAHIEKKDIDNIIKESSPSKEEILKIMCSEYEFSVERISKFADKLVAIKQSAGQKGIGNWF